MKIMVVIMLSFSFLIAKSNFSSGIEDDIHIFRTCSKTFKCPTCGTKVLEQTSYCVKCKKKVKEGKGNKATTLFKVSSVNLLYITSISLDIYSTNKGLRGYDRIVESNPGVIKFFGNKPSVAQLVLYESPFIISSVLLSYLLEKSKFKVCKIWVIPSLFLSLGHFEAAYKNFKICDRYL
jgi:hypothetical protein